MSPCGWNLPEHLADDARALDVRAVPEVVHQVLRVEDPAVDRLEAVAHVGQRARDDDAHGVVHERRLHLLLDRDRDAVACERWCGAVSAHGCPLGSFGRCQLLVIVPVMVIVHDPEPALVVVGRTGASAVEGPARDRWWWSA